MTNRRLAHARLRRGTRVPAWRATARPPSLAFAITLVLVTLGGTSARGQERPSLTPDDYDRWETLGGYDLDPKGRWLAASIRKGDGAVELRVHPVDDDGDAIVLPDASSPLFSADGRWMAFRQGVSPEARERAEDPIRDRLGLVDLTTRSDTVLFEITTMSFRDDGAWIAARGAPASDSVGADLIVFRPGSDLRTTLGSVESFAWEDDGDRLVATLRTASGAANSVLLFDPDSGALRTLDSGHARYRGLTWHGESGRLAVLRSVALDGREEEGHDVLVWDDPGVTASTPRVLPNVGHAVLGDTLRISESRSPRFDDDGEVVFFGVQPWPTTEDGSEEDDDSGDEADQEPDEPQADEEQPPEAPPSVDERDPDDDPGPANVQVWHWNDDEIFRAQESRAAAYRRRTHLAAWHLNDDRTVVLGTELDEPVRIVAKGRWGLVPDYEPYLVPRRFGAATADWYRVDPRTGQRELVAEGLQHGVQTGPEGTIVLVFRDGEWHAVDLDDLVWTRIGSSGSGSEAPDGPSFERSLADYDYPGPRPPWGVDEWMSSGTHAILQDKHDLWLADLRTGALERLTRGADENVRYRALNVDPEDTFASPKPLELGNPLLLTAFHLAEKKQGFARRSPDGTVERLVWAEARVTGLTRARDADRYAFRKERWDDSPDVFVAGAGLRDAKQVTATNPFQDDFAWGRTELLHYTTDAGHELQAILAYPAGFEDGRRYPLILYQYERLSDNLHSYRVPSERSYYDYQTWSQQGYFVLMPDIVYRPGRPGPSALDAVERALDAALATGHVDAEALGLIGHSWGGYQAAYLPTRTDRFAAAVAGAAITDFISFPGTVHWSGGLPEFGHWETGQARMAVPPWRDMPGHLESSPIHEIDQLETPVLLMHGDQDGVVDFRQGLQYYSYARRAGKPVVMLMYPGAGHSLSDEAQRVDYHRRILEWFGHWLKGEPAASWIVEGENYQQREKRLGGSGR